MKALIVEDDNTSRRLLECMMTPLADVDLAEDGEIAVNLFQKALDESAPYDLVCLDILLPKLSGQEVLKFIRQTEEDNGVTEKGRVKIIMATALDDSDNIMDAFGSQCEAYLIKPIDRARLIEELVELGLIEK